MAWYRIAPTANALFLPFLVRFLSWRLSGPDIHEGNVLAGFGAVDVTFMMRAGKNLRSVKHGISLFDRDNQLIWATGNSLERLEPGTYELRHRLPTLMLRPGNYYWYVTLWDKNSLADSWNGVPELIVATPPVGHAADAWQGMLNLPCDFEARRNP